MGHDSTKHHKFQLVSDYGRTRPSVTWSIIDSPIDPRPAPRGKGEIDGKRWPHANTTSGHDKQPWPPPLSIARSARLGRRFVICYDPTVITEPKTFHIQTYLHFSLVDR